MTNDMLKWSSILLLLSMLLPFWQFHCRFSRGLNTNGEFSISSAWNKIREQRTKTKINKFTWHKNIPIKCSFLVWRALRGKLPTNEKLTSFGSDPKECCCCYRPSIDIIEHILLTRHFAMNV